MISLNSTDFTASEGRRFAFPVGIAFGVLAGLFLWHDKAPLFYVAATLGSLLLLAGVLLPSRLGPVYRAWMRLALVISKVTTPIFLGIVYFLVLTPFGIVMRIFGKKPIAHPLRDGGFWHARDGSVSDLTRQF